MSEKELKRFVELWRDFARQWLALRREEEARRCVEHAEALEQQLAGLAR